MTYIQIIVLIIQLFVLYLTLSEMRKGREQQVLPFITFEWRGGSKSGEQVQMKLFIKNEGTGPAVKVRVCLERQEIYSIALISPSQAKIQSIGLSQTERWRQLTGDQEMLLTAFYENIHGQSFISNVNLTKNPHGFPEFEPHSFFSYKQKSPLEMFEDKCQHVVEKLFSHVHEPVHKA